MSPWWVASLSCSRMYFRIRSSSRLVLAFVSQRPVTQRVRARRYAVLRPFVHYLAIFDPRTEALDSRAIPCSTHCSPARVLTDKEVRQLLGAALGISSRHHMRGLSLYTMLGLMASSGLRSGEALRLDRADVDLDTALLMVRQTKFRKDRLVPVHPTTLRALDQYARFRDAMIPKSQSPAFFLNLRGRRVSHTCFLSAFAQARRRSRAGGWILPATSTSRLTSLFCRATARGVASSRRERAGFASGARYLHGHGHACYSDTAYYITATPELLSLAAGRCFGTIPISDGGAP